MSVLDSKTNAPSSTYIMYNKSKRVPDVKVPGWWRTNCLVNIFKLSLHANWVLIDPRAVHLSSSVSDKVIIRNKNSTGAMMSPCLIPTLKSMDVSILPVMSLITLFSYVRLMAEHSLGGVRYFPNVEMSNAWFGVSKALNRSVNATHVGRLWFCLICRSFLIVNVPF